MKPGGIVLKLKLYMDTIDLLHSVAFSWVPCQMFSSVCCKRMLHAARLLASAKFTIRSWFSQRWPSPNRPRIWCDDAPGGGGKREVNVCPDLQWQKTFRLTTWLIGLCRALYTKSFVVADHVSRRLDGFKESLWSALQLIWRTRVPCNWERLGQVQRCRV